MSAVLVESGLDQGAIWHFGEPNQEQRALAAGKAWADLSHRAVVTVAGKDRVKWINDMMTILEFWITGKQIRLQWKT